MKGVKVTRLQLINAKNQTITLNPGLRFVYGTSATGKTLLAELMAYGLGKKKIQIVEELKSFKKVLTEIETESGKIVISRDLQQQSAAVLCQEGQLEEFSESRATKLQLAGGDHSTQFSWYLLEKAKIPAYRSVPENISQSSRISLISFRDIFQYCYLSQDRIDSEDPFGLQPAFELPKAIDAFEVMFKIKPQELYDKEQELFYATQRKEVLVPKIEYLKSFLEAYEFREHDELLNAISDQEKKLEDLKNKIATFNFNEKIITDSKTQSILEEVNKKENEFLKKLNRRLAAIRTIKEWEQLLNSYKAEHDRLALTARASQLMDTMKFKLCPGCGQSIKEPEPKHCALCNREKPLSQSDEATIQSQLKELIRKQKELYEEIQKIKDELSGLNGEISREEKQLREYKKQYLEKREISTDPRINEYKELCLEAGRLESEVDFKKRQLQMLRRLDDLRSEASQYDSEIKKIYDAVEAIKKIAQERKQEVVKILAQKFNAIIQGAPIPEVYKSNITIDSKDYLPRINGDSYLKVSSGGLKVYFMAGYFLAVLEAALEFKDTYHPQILIIDSIHKNISTKEQADKTAVEIFFKKIVEINKKHPDVQMLIIDNELPDFVMSDANLDKKHFTRENGTSIGLIQLN